MDNPEFLSRTEAADEGGVALCTLDKWLREPGGPPWEKFRRRVRIPAAEFKAWLAAQVKEGRP